MSEVNTTFKDTLLLFPFLADQSAEVVEELSKNAHYIKYKFGDTLARLNQPPQYLFFLIQGTVRSVVYSKSLPKQLATLQKFQPGSLVGWTPLSCGRCLETLIASAETVVIAVPYTAIQAAMAMNSGFAGRIRQSVNPSEVFYILDAYLSKYPLVVGERLLETSRLLSVDAQILSVSISQYLSIGTKELMAQLPEGKTWIASASSLPPGCPLEEAEPYLAKLAADKSIEGLFTRFVGIDSKKLEFLLENPHEQASTESTPNLEAQLFQRWKDHQESVRATRVGPTQTGSTDTFSKVALALEAPQLPDPEPIHVAEIQTRPVSSFSFHKGIGSLDSQIAAFRMLADHLSIPFRKELFRRIFGDQVDRNRVVSLALCGAVAESIGLQTQLLELETESISRLEFPLLLLWGDGLAVIYRYAKEKFLLGIPSVGLVELSPEDFKEQWGPSGELLLLRKLDTTPTRRFGFKWFIPALAKYRGVLTEVLLASFFMQLFGLINPLLIQQVIDKAIINSNPDALGILGLLLVVFAIFEGLLLCLRTFLFNDTTNRLDLSLGTEIMDHLLRLPLSYFDRRPVGEVSSRIGEMEKVRSFLTGTALTTILDAVFALIYVVVMLIYSWQLTLIALGVIPILVVLTIFVSPLVRSRLQKRALASAKTQSHLIEVIGSMITVKSQNIELRSRWKWQELYTDFIAEGFDVTLISTTASSINDFLNKLSGLLVIWGGAHLVLSGDLTLGELIAFRVIAGYVTTPLLRMTSVWQSVQETALSLERLSDVIDTPVEAPEDNATRMSMPPINGLVEFRGIDFRYQRTSPLLLKSISLQIEPGQFVAFVGLSGSGKSTITKLLTRLYYPEAGLILVDNVDITKVELYSLRRQFGVVPQESILYDGSIEQNIALTSPEATTEDVIEAAKVACAHDFIMSLPAGYSNQVGEKGSNLSGGQRQRIAIARTILQRPRMLIMDEATSALDYQTERVVCDNLMRELQGRTTIFITHRLSSITSADRIIMMGDGRILESGTHPDLMALKGAYFTLFRQQSKSSSSSPGRSSAGLVLA
jgi:ATP-binding cassette subfamily B protein